MDAATDMASEATTAVTVSADATDKQKDGEQQPVHPATMTTSPERKKKSARTSVNERLEQFIYLEFQRIKSTKH